MVVGGSFCFMLVLGGFWLVFGDFGGSCRFLVVLGGSWWF